MALVSEHDNFEAGPCCRCRSELAREFQDSRASSLLRRDVPAVYFARDIVSQLGCHRTRISPKDRNVIFDKFRQAGDTLTDKPRSTGLGLPIRFHIIEHCGGRIWVTSRPGEDTTFSFTLPLVRKPAPADAT